MLQRHVTETLQLIAKGPEHGKRISAGIERAKAWHEKWMSDAPPGQCFVCGAEFPLYAYNGAMRKFCSDACRQKSYRDRLRMRKVRESENSL